MLNQRAAARSGMIQDGQILFDDLSLPCAIFDLSDAGARIHLLTAAEIPETVTLRLTDGTTRSARRCWQRDAQIGFRFVAAAAH